MNNIAIPFNKPFIIGSEMQYMQQAVEKGKISGDGYFSKQCQVFLEKRYGFQKTLLTTSCTDALEMAAILCNIRPGDEVILPSFTFVSTINAFVLRGAIPVFADINPRNLNIEPAEIEKRITAKTKVIIPVHYAGVPCNMDPILEMAKAHNLLVVEDAAQAIDSKYKGKPAGSLGDFAAFSFHETKNVICGEGGALAINDSQFIERAEIIREKGTNRSAFYRGETAKYDWQDMGSSFLPSDLNAAYLLAQLEEIEKIQKQRLWLWQNYNTGLQSLEKSGKLQLPIIPEYATHNAGLFYLLCRTPEERTALLTHLKSKGILAVFHYLPLHQSGYFRQNYKEISLPVTESVSSRIVRLPLFYSLTEAEQNQVLEAIHRFFR